MPVCEGSDDVDDDDTRCMFHAQRLLVSVMFCVSTSRDRQFCCLYTLKNVDTVGVWALSLLYHCPALLLVSVLVMKHSASLLSAKVVSSFGISSVKAELSNPCACVDVFVCCSPPDGIRFLPQEEETIAEIHAEIKGPGAFV